MLEQLLGSIQSHCHKTWPVRIYSQKVPAEIALPSMYFAPPTTNDADFSKDRFSTLYTLRVLCRATSDKVAITKAEEVANSIRKNGYAIPILNEDGTETGELLRFTRISSNIIADLTAQITMIFEVQTKYEE